MGSVSPRKGTDRFIEVAEKVLAMDEKAFFFWIGDFPDEPFANNIKNLSKNKKHHERLIFTGPLPYSSYTLLPFDLFFLSSVEDPYPLVVLEAAYMKVPSVCYENSGGSRELFEDEAGFLLSESSSQEVANTIYGLLQNKELLEQTGSRVQAKVMSKHSDAKLIKNIFEDIVLNLTHDNNSSK
jgi:glycosyltransferase involved in cell wall biosynthesis